ncbi:asparaginase [Compostibacter hankyongensis]|uniref:Asparaginase n=2 Tax=Compostibacter hankyongensis TaxID=1007089 RepID=A0ABP8FU26_9BACT
MPAAPSTKILIIYTGGTIGMIFDQKKQTLRPLAFSEIKNSIPEMYRLGYHFFVHHFKPPIDSSDMQPEIWVEIAGIIERNYDYYDGFVILHGSDTMSFTASALSFMLENLSKPVVLTGSQLPIGEIRTDARENIITALEIAAARNEQGEAMVPEVVIYFDFMLFRGNRSKKYNAEKFEAFYSMNYPALAEAGVAIKYREQYVLPIPSAPLTVHKKLDTHIAVLKIFPGITPGVVQAILDTPGLRGVILETFGSGNASTAAWFIRSLKAAVDRGILILNITQCDGGSVEFGRYETSKHLQEIGILCGFDMTFEAAVTKMMYLLGQHQDRQEIKRLLQTSLRGELTPDGNGSHTW